MKKEVIIAVAIGLAMGLVITFGVYRVKKAVISTPNSQVVGGASQQEPSSIQSVLALHNPVDGSVQTNTDISITGTTYPNTYVVIFVNDDEVITLSDDTGNFSVKTKLSDGPNLITVIVTQTNGQTFSEKRTVVVSDLLENWVASESASAQTKP
jgi:hypothetical protein